MSCVTLDMDIQQIAEEAMGEEEGAVVVMEAASGDVLALVSQPTFDPTVGQVMLLVMLI